MQGNRSSDTFKLRLLALFFIQIIVEPEGRPQWPLDAGLVPFKIADSLNN